jgi:molecular chaperone HscB
MTSFDLNFARADYFALLGLPRRQALDGEELERLYRDVQANVHPDKHAQGGESDRRLAMQWATKVNEAYLTLKAPLKRAQYLLQLLGHDVQLESNTAMPAEFLVLQMEEREAVADARAAGDIDELDRMHRHMKQEMAGQYAALQEALDVQNDPRRAGEIVRQLMFQEKLLQEIDEALEAVEA